MVTGYPSLSEEELPLLESSLVIFITFTALDQVA